MSRVSRFCVILALGVLSATVTGCLPRQLVVWSPDGAAAVVMTQNETYLCNAEGKLKKTDVGAVSAAAWLPDSKRVVLAVQKKAEKWADLESKLDNATKQAVIAVADALEKAVVQTPADQELTDEQSQEIAREVFEGKGSLTQAALLYLRDTRPGELKKRLGERWEDIAKIAAPYVRLGFYRRDGLTLEPKAVLFNSLKAVQQLRLSPKADMVAMVMPSDRTQEAHTLWAAKLAPNATPVEIADMVAIFPDWSADGQLVYIQSAGSKDNKPVVFGALIRRAVADGDGNQPNPKELVEVAFDQAQSVRCLPNGQIFFTSANLNLPIASEDVETDTRPFVFKPGEGVAPLLDEEAAKELGNLPVLELSPDGKTLSLSNGMKVALLSWGDAKLTWIQRKEADSAMLPSWRKSGELCFITAPAKDAGEDARPEVTLWADGKTRVISKTWPDEVMENLTFAPKQQPVNAPTTQPADKK